jgi:hypothetical protein
MIPPFTSDGVLPQGIFEATWAEFTERFGGSARRKVLLTGLHGALDALRLAGGTTVYVDGSFVSDVANPGDWDACWEEDGVDFSHLDPVLLELGRGRVAQTLKYLGEMFLAHGRAAGDGAYMVDFFQRSRDQAPKGIVALDVRRL